ncbi:MAG: prepilin-type N-terminal cleavage/methylation domain-containing protein [Nitrospirales bacterium]|nr:prepilin-type N-terminal cleavage/methylation domain-containing protein [Nitrospirales bacterium]
MSTEKGFTLLELLIVMFLMTLLLGIAAVSLSNSLPSSQVNATARDIASTLKHARSLALLSGEDQVLSLDLNARRYGVEGKPFRAIPADIAVMVTTPLSGEIRSGTYRIVFRPMGVADAGTIIVSNSKRTVLIEADPVVGAVRLK